MTVDFVEDQVCFFGPDFLSGKTYQEACPAQERDTAEKTSRQSLKKSQKSSAKKLPLFLSLTRDGPMPDASAVWVTAEHPFPSLGDYTMHSFGEQPSMLMAECSLPEHPSGVSVSRLSQILEDSAPQKYYLSERACTGILNRASRRGKELPKELKEALLQQSGSGGRLQPND